MAMIRSNSSSDLISFPLPAAVISALLHADTDCTVLVLYKTREVSASIRAIFSHGDSFNFRHNYSTGFLSGRWFGASAADISVNLTGFTAAVNDWVLAAVSIDKSEKRVHVVGRSSSMAGAIAADGTNGSWAPKTSTPADANVGVHLSNNAPLVDVAGLCVRSTEVMTVDELDDLWDLVFSSGALDEGVTAHGPMALRDYSGVVMGGIDNALWAWFGSAPTDPNTDDVNPTSPVTIGGAVNTTNFVAWHGGGAFDKVFTARVVTSASGWTYAADDEALGRYLQGLGVAWVADPVSAPLTHHFCLGLEPHESQRVAVIVHGNSRSAKRFESSATGGGQLSSGNFADGLMQTGTLNGRVVGTILRPLTKSANRTWPFVSNLGGGETIYMSDASDVVSLASTHVSSELCSQCLGSGGDEGPGDPVLLQDGVTICVNGAYDQGLVELNSMLQGAGDEVEVAHWVFELPGSSQLAYSMRKASRAESIGTETGTSGTVVLDTTQHQHTITGSDTVGDDTLVIDGEDLTSEILASDEEVTWVAVVTTGDAARTIGRILSVELVEGDTVVTLDRDWRDQPGEGDTVAFGPLRRRRVSGRYLLTALDVAAGNKWVGMALTDLGDGLGIFHCGWVDWCVVNRGAGYCVAGVGWGGHGYDEQISSFHQHALAQVAMDLQAAYGRVIHWLTPATQDTAASTILAYTALITDGVPIEPGVMEVVWAVDGEHTTQDMADWNDYVIANAADNDCVGLSAYKDVRVGPIEEAFRANLRSNGAHHSRQGNITYARVWREQGALAALDFDPPAAGSSGGAYANATRVMIFADEEDADDAGVLG